MLKNKATLAIAGIMAVVGALGGTAFIASAQSSTATNTAAAVTSRVATNTVDTPESPNDPADTDMGTTRGHRQLGGDGVVISISGTTIVVGEESDEGGASYTVDASKATVTSNGASAKLSDIKVGDKIFVDGAVSGNTINATSVSLGHGGDHKDANDEDGGSASKEAETPGASDASDQ